MHGIGERVNDRDGFHPGRKRLVGYTAPLGKYSTVLSMPKMARGTSGSLTRTMIRNIMLISASAVTTTSNSIRASRSGIQRIGNARDDRAAGDQHDAGDDGFGGAGQSETQDQFEFPDGRDEIALVQAARLVINENDAAADHGRNENGQHDGARQQKLDVRHVGINLDDGQRGVGASCAAATGGEL